MNWVVTLTNKAHRQLKKLPEEVILVSQLLARELEDRGPYLANWPNYGKLYAKKNKEIYHCHLIKGNPTYVSCWEVINKRERLIEVYYVGTHEKAPY